MYKMIDIVFSKGYLNVKEDPNYLDTSKSWDQAFTDTTNYERNIFICGDVIYVHDAHKSIALLITKVYEDDENGKTSSQLDYQPPVGKDSDDVNTEDSKIVQSFNTCEGTVYMFKKGVTFGEIKQFASQYTSGSNSGEYRKLYPSNVSKYDNENSDPTFTLNKKEEGEQTGELPEGYPTQGDIPKYTEGTTEDKFNLTNGVTIEGWLIYRRSTVDSTSTTEVQEPINITGDIIKTGPIVISKVGTTLNVGSVFKIPYNNGNFYYNGEATKFSSEPLNSEHYQSNYGDTTGNNVIQINESKIYSLTKILEHQF